MTSKLTSEILDDETLAELIAFRRSRVEYCQKEGLPYQKALHDSMMLALEELQERRKVERDTEPYGFTDGDRRGMIYKPEHSDRLSEPVPVYRHAQPAPVVPDGYVMVPKEPTKEMIDAGWLYYMATKLPSSKGTYKAMLAAAPQSPGSEPATVPGKWIPVSERMPETDGNYWGWWSESKRQGPVWFIKSELQAQFQSSEITHWMPLPAAPQEVKGE
ncbi:DUF551 domain-containing protein [Klebsiella variicola]|uniref:DUF551 domain-containing protein n=1 Tax=Klebsiella variicola TaxID=244366 RepID=UPI00215D3C7C|nr:DUF551 domain-containing protein [Klebsiella variicola]